MNFENAVAGITGVLNKFDKFESKLIFFPSLFIFSVIRVEEASIMSDWGYSWGNSRQLKGSGATLLA